MKGQPEELDVKFMVIVCLRQLCLIRTKLSYTYHECERCDMRSACQFAGKRKPALAINDRWLSAER